MTRHLVVSDIHGNAPALHDVLEDAAGDYDALISCGDMIGILPFNAEVINIISDNARHAVLGNHDCRVLDEYIYKPNYMYARREAALVNEQLTDRELAYIQRLPDRVGDGEILLAHSNPLFIQSLSGTATGFSANDGGLPKGEYTRIGPHLNGRTAYCGHTHNQAALNVDRFPGQEGLIVNPGSVGQPWTGDAEYAIVDTETQEYDLRSVEPSDDRIEEIERRAEHVGVQLDDHNKPTNDNRKTRTY